MRIEQLPEGATVADLLASLQARTDLAAAGATAPTAPMPKPVPKPTALSFKSLAEELEHLRAEERRWRTEDAAKLAAQARAAGEAYGRGDAEPEVSVPVHLPMATVEEMEVARNIEAQLKPQVLAEVAEWCRTHREV